MPLFKGRSSLLEVQDRALIKTAKERAERIDELEREVQILRERTEQTDKGDRELKSLRETVEHETDTTTRSTLRFGTITSKTTTSASAMCKALSTPTIIALFARRSPISIP
jgi:hypothetical protein